MYMCINMRDSGPTRHAAPFTRAHLTYLTLYMCASRYPQHSATSLRQKIIIPTTILPSLIPFFPTIFPSTTIYRSLLSEYVQSSHCYNYYCLCCFLSSLLQLLSLLLLSALILLLIIILVVFLVAHCGTVIIIVTR